MKTENSTLAAGPLGQFKTVSASFELYPQFNTSRKCMRVFKVSNILNIYIIYISFECNYLCKVGSGMDCSLNVAYILNYKNL